MLSADIIDDLEKDNIMVTICLVAYNHAPYIETTIQFILKQEIDFKIQLLIHDDASTDGTSEIIRQYAKQYPKIITAIIQKENKYQKNMAVDIDMIPYIYGKYVALCEGDDYWPTLQKLKMQVEYMETHPEVAGTGGLTRYYNDDGMECLEPMPKHQYVDGIVTKREFARWRGFNVATNTLLFKSEIMKDANFICAKKISPKVGDILVLASIFERGDMYIFGECFQYHRIQTRSNASNYNSLFDTTEKFRDVVRALNAVVQCFQCHTIKKWYIQYVSVYFWVFLKSHNLKMFFEIIKGVISCYRKYTVIAILRTFFVFLPLTIGKHIKNALGVEKERFLYILNRSKD